MIESFWPTRAEFSSVHAWSFGSVETFVAYHRRKSKNGSNGHGPDSFRIQECLSGLPIADELRRRRRDCCTSAMRGRFGLRRSGRAKNKAR